MGGREADEPGVAEVGAGVAAAAVPRHVGVGRFGGAGFKIVPGPVVVLGFIRLSLLIDFQDGEACGLCGSSLAGDLQASGHPDLSGAGRTGDDVDHSLDGFVQGRRVEVKVSALDVG